MAGSSVTASGDLITDEISRIVTSRMHSSPMPSSHECLPTTLSLFSEIDSRSSCTVTRRDAPPWYPTFVEGNEEA